MLCCSTSKLGSDFGETMCYRGNELGRGTFGIVSEAMDATTGEMLAVKQVVASELRPKAVEILER